MSTFLKKIAELTNNDEAPETPEDAAMRKAKDDDSKGKATPQQKELLRKKRELNQAIGNKIDKATQELQNASVNADNALAEAGPGDFVPRPGPEPAGGEFTPAPMPPAIPPVPPVPEPAPPEPLTAEGETFLVNLARKALFVDVDDVGLTDSERESINKEAEPNTAKKVAKILRKIIVDYGLSEGFTLRANVLLEDLKKKTIE